MSKTDVLSRSNADRIRSMTDIELAEYLCSIVDCEVCPARVACDATPFAYLKWLQEAHK